jgi:hypothetical protein
MWGVVDGDYARITSVSNAAFGSNTLYEIETEIGKQRMELYENQLEAVGEADGRIGIQPKTEIPNEILTLEAAIRFEHESKKKKWDSLAQGWREQGRCPQCGEKCFYHLSTPICPKHGACE